jgi:hypothetical protein
MNRKSRDKNVKCNLIINVFHSIENILIWGNEKLDEVLDGMTSIKLCFIRNNKIISSFPFVLSKETQHYRLFKF